MDDYCNYKRMHDGLGLMDQMKAYNSTLEEKDKNRLGRTEYYLLILLARRFGKENTIKGQLLDGCHLTMDTLQEDSWMERKAICNALTKLVKSGFLRKTMSPRWGNPEGKLTWEGKQRKARGLSLENPAKNNYVAQPTGPKSKGGKNNWWDHCCYFATEKWDQIVWDERPNRAEAAPVIAGEISSEDQAILAALDKPAEETNTQSVAEDGTPTFTVSTAEITKVYGFTAKYFSEHETFANADNPRGAMNTACKLLAKVSLNYMGTLESAGDFMRWLHEYQPKEIYRLTEELNHKKEKVTKCLGGKNGLILSIETYWEKFVAFEKEMLAGKVGTEDEQSDEEPVSVGAGHEELVDELE